MAPPGNVIEKKVKNTILPVIHNKHPKGSKMMPCHERDSHPNASREHAAYHTFPVLVIINGSAARAARARPAKKGVSMGALIGIPVCRSIVHAVRWIDHAAERAGDGSCKKFACWCWVYKEASTPSTLLLCTTTKHKINIAIGRSNKHLGLSLKPSRKRLLSITDVI